MNPSESAGLDNPDILARFDEQKRNDSVSEVGAPASRGVELRRTLDEEKNREAEKMALEKAQEEEKKAEARKKLLTDKKIFGETVRNAANTSVEVADPGMQASKGKALEDLEDAGFTVEYFEGKSDEELQEIKDSMDNLAKDKDADEKTEEILSDLKIEDEIIREWVDRVELQIRRNEGIYRELLFADYDKNNFEQFRAELSALWNVFVNDGTLQTIVDEGFLFDSTSEENNFELLQEAYMRKMLVGWNDLLKHETEVNETAESLDGESTAIGKVAQKTYETQRAAMRSAVSKEFSRTDKEKINIFRKRGWSILDVDLSKAYILEHFGLVEKEEEVDKTDMGILERYFMEFSAGMDIALWIFNKGESNKDLSDKNKELLEDFATFRKFIDSLDKRGKFDEILGSDIDGAIRRMVLLENDKGEPKYPVAEAVVIYQRLLNEAHKADKNEPVDIDKLQARFLNEYGVDKPYAKLAMMVGRDLVRATGIDVEMEISVSNSADGGKKKVLSNVSGGLMRDVLGFKYLLENDPSITNSQLVESIDMRVPSFFNKLRGINKPFHEEFEDANDIVGLVNSSVSENGKVYRDWVENITKANESVKKEKEVMRSNDPVVALASVFEEYKQILGADKSIYLKSRVHDVFAVYLDKHRKLRKYDVDTVKMVVGWNEKYNLFADDAVLNGFLEDMGLPKKGDEDKDGEFYKKLNGLYGPDEQALAQKTHKAKVAKVVNPVMDRFVNGPRRFLRRSLSSIPIVGRIADWVWKDDLRA